MKLNQNKKDEILNLPSCSKDLLIWIQLQALQEDIIEITHKHYTKDVKVSLNTFKKALGGLLDNKILFSTSKKGKFRLNKDFIADSYFYHNGLGDFDRNKNCYGGISFLLNHPVTLSYFQEKEQQRRDQMVEPEYIEKIIKEIEIEESKLK